MVNIFKMNKKEQAILILNYITWEKTVECVESIMDSFSIEAVDTRESLGNAVNSALRLLNRNSDYNRRQPFAKRQLCENEGSI